MRSALLVMLMLSITPSLWSQNVPAFVPLAEVTPGLEGYGIGPVNGKERGRFSFRVVSVERSATDLYPLIVVELFADTTHRSEPGILLAGMSGSPLFVGNRLLGAISRGPTFPLNSMGYVLPAELMDTFRPLELERSEPYLEPGSPTRWQPGESYIYCSVWGDVNRCSGATITGTRSDGLVMAQGHSTSSLANRDEEKEDKRRVATGSTAMPVWKARVYGKIPMIDFSTIISGPTGPVAGAIIWNGEYGHLIDPARRPLGIPVNVFVAGPGARRTFHVAYSSQSVTEITESLKGIARLEFGSARPLMLRATVRIRGIAEPFHVYDAFINWNVVSKDEDTGALDRLLRWAVLWTHPRSIVESVDVALFTATAELYEPNGYHMALGLDGSLTVHLSMHRERDFVFFNRTVSVHTIKGASNYMLVTGGWLQGLMLQSSPLAEVPAAFNKVDNAAALYLVAFTTAPGTVKESVFAPKGWTPDTDRMRFHILAKLTSAGVVVAPKGDEPVRVEFTR